MSLSSSSYRLIAAISVLLMVASTSHAASQMTYDDTNPCRLWLAPSHVSTEANPKYGIFAGVDYAQDEHLPNSELALPLVDFLESANKDDGHLHREILDYIESFLWTSEYAGAKWEGNYSTTILVPGAGVLANYHSGFYNVDWSQGSVLLREPDGTAEPGKAHPSRGAITDYYNLTVKATQNIRAGMELFANFGDVWDEGDNEKNIYQDKLNRWDYMNADQILDEVIVFMDKYDDEMSPELKDEALDFILDKLLGTAAGKHAKVIRSLIPDNPRKLKKVNEMGGTFHYRNSDLVKSPAWLNKYGLCVDNIRSGPSTVKDAGRGAFASRNLKLGATIVPVPMVPIANEDVMEMYTIFEDDNELKYDRDKSLGKQQIFNYCFGHPESSVLLMPVGPMVTYINHAPTGLGANAYLRWSEHPYIYNDEELLDLHPEQLAVTENPNLVMELIAIIPIAEGDEIFIDYGKDWETMWGDYKEAFETSYADGKWPLKAREKMVEFKDKPFPVDVKQNANPYPKGVATACFIESTEVEDGTPKTSEHDDDIVQWINPTSFAKYKGHNMFACDLMERTELLTDGNMYNYTVLARQQDTMEALLVKGVPHAAVTLVDLPYTSDMHTPGAFRQWIGIQDAQLPQAWRNLRG